MNIKIKCDAAPLLSFVRALNRLLESSEGSINLPDLPLELFRVEYDIRSAAELGIVLYPSDAFFDFVATATGDVDFLGIK